MTDQRWDRPLYWIEGQMEGADKWVPLYCWRDPLFASAVMKYIIDMDVLPPELQGYDDFRRTTVEPPKPPPRRAQAPTAQAEARQSPPEGPRRRRQGSRRHREAPGA